MSEIVADLISGSDKNLPLIHRDLSWLEFNARVLEEAQDSTNPLFERLKFLAISVSNLDEFHMVRMSSVENTISSLQRKQETVKLNQEITIRNQIYAELVKFHDRQKQTLETITKELSAIGIELVNESSPIIRGALGRKVFEEQVLKLLPEPEAFEIEKLSQLSNLEIAAIYPGNVWVKIPKTLPAVIIHQDLNNQPNLYIFFLDQLIRAQLLQEKRFEHNIGFVCLTRAADENINLTNSDPDFIPDAVLSSIKKRDRDVAVRLQVSADLPAEFTTAAASALKLQANQIIKSKFSLYVRGLWSLVNNPSLIDSKFKNLYLPALQTKVPKAFRDLDKIFIGLKQKDYLLHHPYDSFDAYVAFIEAACKDPKVIKIEQTVYRMDAVSPVTKLLMEHAGKKDIRVIIELRARFDELNNLRISEQMRKAGVKVSFGFGNLKLHAKLALITRQEENGIQLYTHLSSGNYNAITSRIYTDMGVITSNPEIGADARQFLDAFYEKKEPHAFKQIVIAPQFLARRLLAHIKEETENSRAGKNARIFAKVNALVDEKIIAALYQASQAGVKVDLVVRGACSLIPGIAGISDNIRVISIVDRFLEHNRLYYFESSAKMYLSSADWMPRNFFSRLEIAFPILDKRVFEYLKTVVIPAYLNDSVKARQLSSNGLWQKPIVTSDKTSENRAQLIFEKLAASDYRATPLAWKKSDYSLPKSTDIK